MADFGPANTPLLWASNPPPPPTQGSTGPLDPSPRSGGTDALGRLSGGDVTQAPGLLPSRGCDGQWAAGGQQGVDEVCAPGPRRSTQARDGGWNPFVLQLATLR